MGKMVDEKVEKFWGLNDLPFFSDAKNFDQDKKGQAKEW